MITSAEYSQLTLRTLVTHTYLAATRSEGRVGVRRPKLSPQQQAELVRGVHEERYPMAEAARLFGVHPPR